jgi:hypothetical protein
VESEITIPPADAGSGPTSFRGDVPPVATRSRRPWWLLAVGASLIVGGSVQHAFDQKNAVRDLYRMQVLTTEWRFLDEESSQVALPVARRNISAFDDLAGWISGDGGVNGCGTLQVTLGAGSVAQSTQIDFSVTVASPYASTTVAVWSILVSSQGAISSSDGACVLSSTLLGPRRATTDLQLGGGYFVPACSPRWWSSGSAMDPHLGVAGISHSPG